MRAMLIAAGSVALIVGAPVSADDVKDFMLDITQIEVKVDGNMQFREGVKAYIDCYKEAKGDSSWSTWGNVDGAGVVYHVVSRMDSWAELDERDEAAAGCWSIIREQAQPYMKSVNTIYAKRMPDWSPDEEGDDDATVVRLHNFSVDDNQKFRAAIGTVTGIMKATDYEHMGTWYRVQGGGVNDPEYMVASSYKNFAAMDEDMAGPYGTMKEHAGEDTADLVWEQYLDSLKDGEAYWSNLLSYDEDLSYDD